jgi:hypothetical protein
LAEKDRLDVDFERFNRAIEQTAEEEIDKIRKQINALKEQAAKSGEELLSPFSDEEEGNREKS